MGQGPCCARLRVAWCLQGFLMCVLLWECALKMVNFEFCVLDTWFTLRSCQSRNYFRGGNNLGTTSFCPREVSLGQLPPVRSQKPASLGRDISREDRSEQLEPRTLLGGHLCIHQVFTVRWVWGDSATSYVGWREGSAWESASLANMRASLQFPTIVWKS